MRRVLLIGGYPKGYNIPFHPKTRSGRILRDMLTTCGNRYQVRFGIIDLWRTKEQEDAGLVEPGILLAIKRASAGGWKIAALGWHVYGHLRRQLDAEIRLDYLPHPAARATKYLAQLEKGLQEYALLPCLSEHAHCCNCVSARHCYAKCICGCCRYYFGEHDDGKDMPEPRA